MTTIWYPDPLAPHDRETKLPQWAQTLVGQLRDGVRREQARAQAVRAETTPGETDTIRDVYSDHGPIGLSKGETIRFIIGPDRSRDYVDVHVDRHNGNCIEITTHDTLWVSPRSGNGIRVGYSTWDHLKEGFRS